MLRKWVTVIILFQLSLLLAMAYMRIGEQEQRKSDYQYCNFLNIYNSEERIIECKLDEVKRLEPSRIKREEKTFTETSELKLVQNIQEQIEGEDEKQVLCRIVEAEAGNEDEVGKLLIANVILNRVHNEAFPNTITQVVFQNRGGVYQFSPIANKTYYKVNVSEETRQVVERALNGEDASKGALYFMARNASSKKNVEWFDTHLTWLYKHGAHEFYM